MAHFRPHTTDNFSHLPKTTHAKGWKNIIPLQRQEIPFPAHRSSGSGKFLPTQPTGHRSKSLKTSLPTRGGQLTESRKLFLLPEERPGHVSKSSSGVEPPQQEEHQQKGEGTATACFTGDTTQPQLAFTASKQPAAHLGLPLVSREG